ncbi:DUF397 domain-containing protein [Streptomyces sp. NPDC005492]|uniref:DUF397 domain-containing protein n=1 Tax=Streptomyces sp. NPDC005492 TaxID=3156883 RepID=UPI0033BDB0F2
MRTIDLSLINWRKSSYSNSDGGNCVEVSDDLLTTALWRKSSHSNSTGGECLEVAQHIPGLIPVRDSKDPSQGALLFGLDAWAGFIGAVKQS